jgi:Domain of unknown function (DUF4386)
MFMSTLAVDKRWRDLYKIGAIAAIISELVIFLGIVAYVIAPYTPGTTSTESIFLLLQDNRLAGLLSLDILLLLGTLISLLVFLALYVSLKQVNESYALIALALGIVGVFLLVPGRPIPELVALSGKYVNAATDSDKSQYLAAGTALLAQFDGINWFMSTLLGGFSLLISSTLMLQSNLFSKFTAYVGLATNIAACGFFLPGIGIVLLFLTLPGYMLWYFLLARHFFQIAAGLPSGYRADKMSRSEA